MQLAKFWLFFCNFCPFFLLFFVLHVLRSRVAHPPRSNKIVSHKLEWSKISCFKLTVQIFPTISRVRRNVFHHQFFFEIIVKSIDFDKVAGVTDSSQRYFDGVFAFVEYMSCWPSSVFEYVFPSFFPQFWVFFMLFEQNCSPPAYSLPPSGNCLPSPRCVC